MSTPLQRRFTILDAMILVAATAVGMGIARGMRHWLWAHTNVSIYEGSVNAVLLPAARWITLGLPILTAWTIALLLLVLRRPRPRLDDLLQRPGATACGAAVLALIVNTVNLTLLFMAAWAKDGWRATYEELGKDLVSCLIQSLGIELGAPGLAVTSAWLLLALSGRWRSDAGWLDRMGRATGLAWVILMVLDPWITTTFQGTWS